MLSNVSDDLASGMEGDRRLLTYCYVLTKNAILGMHLAFFGWDKRSTCRVLVGWHTRRRSGSSTSGLLSFSHFNCEGMISWKKSKFFFSFLVRGAWRCPVLHQAHHRGEQRFCTWESVSLVNSWNICNVLRKMFSSSENCLHSLYNIIISWLEYFSWNVFYSL